MSVHTIQMTLIVLCTVANASAAEVPLGHPDFYPSPERPVGFRGDGNGAFPGAQPPLRFQEGTPGREKVLIRNKKKGTEKEEAVYVLKDQASRNLLWKLELPGWSNSHPIIVGDRVFAYCESRTLVCVDLNEGEILWRRDLNPLAIRDGLDAERSAQMDDLLDMAQASFFTIKTVSSRDHLMVWRGKNRSERVAKQLEDPANRALFARIARTFESWRQRLGEIDPELLPHLEEDIVRAKRLAAGELPEDWDRFAGTGAQGAVADAIAKKYRVAINTQWTTMVGFLQSVPVSDGRHVYVTMGQGQTACFDLDGNPRWVRCFDSYIPPRGRLRCHVIPSPLLIEGVLVAQHAEHLRGLDATTGRTLWESEVAVGKGYNVGTHKHMVLRDGDRAVDVIATTNGEILRAADGKVLAKLPYHHGKEGGGPSMIAQGDVLVFEKYKDDPENTKKGGGYWRGRLVLEGDTVTLAEIRRIEGYDRSGGPPATPILADGMIVANNGVYDLETGKKLGNPPGRSAEPLTWNSGIMVAGQQVIWAADGDNGGYYRNRADGQVMMDFRVYDLSERTWKDQVREKNILGGLNLPRVRAMEVFMPEFYEDRHFSNYGIPPQWGCYNGGGMFAQANRLVIQSASHLYCIGDPKQPYSWNTSTRPDGLLSAR